MKKYILTLLLAISIIIPSIAQKGYRGFVDVAPGFSTAKIEEKYIETKEGNFTISLSTVHGYQFNNHIFAGIGTQLSYFNEWKFFHNNIDDVYSRSGVSLPIFATLRYDYSVLSAHGFYCALRGGYSLGRCKGTYWGAEMGLHLQTMRLPVGFNIGLRGELLSNASNDIYWGRMPSDDYFRKEYYGADFSSIWAIKLALGIEF